MLYIACSLCCYILFKKIFLNFPRGVPEKMPVGKKSLRKIAPQKVAPGKLPPRKIASRKNTPEKLFY